MTKFCRLVPPSWSQSPQNGRPPRRLPRSLTIILIYTVLATGFNCTVTAWFFALAQVSEPGSQSSLALGWVQTFLRKSLGNSSALVDTLWSRIKQNSQYQWQKVHNWTSHLEHPESIEFDVDRAPEKPDLIRFFWEGRQPSVEITQEGAWLLGYLGENAIDAKAKANLQSLSILRGPDQRHSRSNCPTYTTMAMF